MKILMINYEYPPVGGGGGVFTCSIAQEMAKTHDVDVLTGAFAGLKNQEKINGVNIYRIPVLNRKKVHTSSALSLISFPFSCLWHGNKLIQKKEYDIINSYFAIPVGPAALSLSRKAGIPMIINLMGGDIHSQANGFFPHRNPILRKTIQNVLNGATRVISGSNDLANYAKTLYAPSKEITVVPLKLPEPKFNILSRKDLCLDEKKMYLVSVGRLIKRKNFDLIIKAISVLRNKGKDLNLILIGDGPEIQMLKDLALKEGVLENILFLNNLSDQEKFQYLWVADIYVMSSIHEAFGLVLLEAMFCGLPIISTNNGGQIDIIKQGKNGLLIDIYDLDGIVNAIVELANDSVKRKIMGEYNKEDVKNYRVSSLVKQYESFFEEAIKSYSK